MKNSIYLTLNNAHLLGRALILLPALLMLGGCLSEHTVTMRPEYAYPQNLMSLCGRATELTVANIGEFESSSRVELGANRLLLSSQLLPQEPARQRHYQYLRIAVSPAPELTVTGFDNDGAVHSQTFSQDDIHCGEDGEMLLSFPSSSYYLWASMGTKGKALALWTNPFGGLVIQNRWNEKLRGIVGGSISGDAWAAFDAAAAPAIPPPAPLAAAQETVPAALNSDCASLTGDYESNAEVVHLDGTLASRDALDQFFRAEIIGEHPANQNNRRGNRLRLLEDSAGSGIVLSLYDNDEELVSRTIESSEMTCEGGRWRVKGAKKVASAWLLLIASGGVSWENLVLWRDRNGDLLVEGTHKTRNALFLIPMGDTQKLFMAFHEKQSPVEVP